MTEHNHRRGTKRKFPKLIKIIEQVDPNLNYSRWGNNHNNGVVTYTKSAEKLHNGYTPRNGKPYGYLDKSLHSWGRKGQLSDTGIFATIGNDFTNGTRGMAKAVRGAKKFVRSRHRFHENAAVRKLITEE